jgi:hypothetical protein
MLRHALQACSMYVQLGLLACMDAQPLSACALSSMTFPAERTTYKFPCTLLKEAAPC